MNQLPDLTRPDRFDFYDFLNSTEKRNDFFALINDNSFDDTSFVITNQPMSRLKERMIHDGKISKGFIKDAPEAPNNKNQVHRQV